ncbi:substrate-binding periplasmic protein [Xinfangfangia pollutisoli]|uniref:substrate-binding periplasmic protein n=1 Tax=Xinfangfangia pollutisoli TaxID=2865960 RepID=UPI001CD3C832|nr:transporter substrate-binding domain-containing protein [Xinfangfangia pollutisoli]
MACFASLSALGAALVLAAAGDPPAGAGNRLVIGTDESFPPYVQPQAGGGLEGFDIDVMTEICRRSGHVCQWQTAAFDELIPGVISGRFDAAIGGIAVTPERRALVDFTTPYANGDETEWFVGLPGAPAPETARIAVQSGTIHEAWLRAEGLDFRSFPGEAEALQSVGSGESDLALGPFRDRPDLEPLLLGAGVEYLYPVDIPDEGTGIVLCKGSPLKPDFDAAISAMRADGTIDSYDARWF